MWLTMWLEFGFWLLCLMLWVKRQFSMLSYVKYLSRNQNQGFSMIFISHLTSPYGGEASFWSSWFKVNKRWLGGNSGTGVCTFISIISMHPLPVSHTSCWNILQSHTACHLSAAWGAGVEDTHTHTHTLTLMPVTTSRCCVSMWSSCWSPVQTEQSFHRGTDRSISPAPSIYRMIIEVNLLLDLPVSAAKIKHFRNIGRMDLICFHICCRVLFFAVLQNWVIILIAVSFSILA